MDVIFIAKHLVHLFLDNIETIGGYAGFGAFLAVIVQSLKVKFHIDERVLSLTKRIKLDGPKMVNILLTALTALPFIVDEILRQLDLNQHLNASYPWLFASAVWLHRFAVSPLYGKIRDKLEASRDTKAKAAAYERIVQTQNRAATNESPAPSDIYDPTISVQG